LLQEDLARFLSNAMLIQHTSTLRKDNETVAETGITGQRSLMGLGIADTNALVYILSVADENMKHHR